jgi:uncharacterized protein
MDQRLTLLTLGVADVARARAFYERLGWVASSASQDEVAFFQAGGLVLALYGREALEADLGRPSDGPAGAGVTLALNQSDAAAVDRTIGEFVDAGGTLIRPGHRAVWGGHVGYVADLDGYVWEIAFNPFWPLDADGAIVLPPPQG